MRLIPSSQAFQVPELISSKTAKSWMSAGAKAQEVVISSTGVKVLALVIYYFLRYQGFEGDD